MSNEVAGIASDRLKSFVERIENLEEEKRGLQEDIKEVYAEAKGTGFDVKIIREIIRLRKMDKANRQEREALIELYKEALGMDIDHLFADRSRPQPTPIEVAIEVSKAKDTTVPDPETGEVIDVAALADKLIDFARAGDPRALSIIAAAKVGTDAMAGVAGVMAGQGASYAVGGRA